MKQKLDKLSITQIIVFLCVFLVTLQIAYGLMVNIRLNEMGHHVTQIKQQYIPLTKEITAITEHQLEQGIEFERAFRFALEFDLDPNASGHFTHAVEQYEKLSQKLDQEMSNVLKALAHDIDIATSQSIANKFMVLAKHIKAIKSKHDDWSDDVHGIFKLLEKQDIKSAISASDNAEKQLDQLSMDVVKTLHEIEEYTKDAITSVEEEEHNILILGITMLIVSVVMASILTKIITAYLGGNLDKLKQAITSIAQGDLHTYAESKLAKDFGINEMRETLKNTLLTVKSGADEMLSASSELAQVSSGVLKNVNRQAEEVELVSTAITEMEATAVEVARHASNTQSSTTSMTNKADQSSVIILKAMNSMTELTSSLTDCSQNIQELEEHSSSIKSVLMIIKGIADQTNLLALNAAIEAARAGDQGRGFAVVADEVRTLAQRTQESTIEIEKTIGLFTTGTTQAVGSMSSSSAHGEICYQATSDSNHNIEAIQSSIAQINEMNIQIAAAAEQQACTSQELSRNAVVISKLTSENVSSGNRVSVASEQLAAMAKQLSDKIVQFKLA